MCVTATIYSLFYGEVSKYEKDLCEKFMNLTLKTNAQVLSAVLNRPLLGDNKKVIKIQKIQ